MSPLGATTTSAGELKVSGPLPATPERHQHVPFRAELDDRMADAAGLAAIGRPHVVVTIDIEAVREDEHPGAETRHELAVGVEMLDRRQVRPFAGVRTAAIERPYALAVAVDVDADHHPPFAA
jgi:hypothetical protein